MNKITTMYQIYDEQGNKVLEPYHYLTSAQYMCDKYLDKCTIIEIEIGGCDE
jgi:hypothetical protein